MGRTVKRLSLTAWIFIAMTAGVVVGVAFPDVAKSAAMPALSNVFLRLIKSIVAPLIFGTLVHGVAGTGSLKTMGRISVKALIYFEVATTAALFIGLAAVNLAQPGAGIHIARSTAETQAVHAPATLESMLEHTFPASVIDAMARGEVLQLVIFSLLFGAACAAIGPKAGPVVEFCASLSEVMFRYTKYVMYTAPFGVFGAMAYAIGSHGVGVLFNLGKLVLTLYAALAVFVLVVFGAAIAIARIPLRRFYAAVKQPWLIAFSTATSESALPVALENMEKFGVPEHIVSFVIPAGYSFNLDGSTLYLSLASVFVAQAAGIQMPLSQQLLMLLTLMLTSKGVAGVPRASLVILAGTLAAFQLPVEGIAVLLGVDVLMDMVRTSVNVLGNCLASAVVARWEGVRFEESVMESV